jgi:CRP/FNR family cyclic AMP-dependent transcriptional regulator
MALSVQDALRDLPFVEDLEPRHIDRLAAMAKEVGFEKDQIIFREGDSHKQFYIILFGKVALEVTAAGGIVRVLTVGGGGELGWSFLLSKTGRHFRARALERVRALVFEGEEIIRACEEDPLFGYRLTKRVLRVVSDRLEATRMRFLDVYRN